ncbi:MAG: phosphatase PAP2 family protein [Bacteroidota bacterium]
MNPSRIQGQATWEFNWLHQLADNRTTGKNKFYHAISDANGPLTVAIPIGWLAYGLLDKNNSAIREEITWTISQLVNGAFTYAMKAAVNRARPAAADPTLVALEDVRIHSFPSGHTSSAFALATSISMDHPQLYVVAPAFVYASLVGYSRCYLGVHYPSDVLAGAALGSASAWATDKAERWIRDGNARKKNKQRLTFIY